MSYIGNGISWLVKRALTGDMHAEPDAALYDNALPFFEQHYTELLLQSKPFAGVMEGLNAMRTPVSDWAASPTSRHALPNRC